MKPLHPPLPDDLVTFNVRGRIFQTTVTSLRRFPESVLFKMVDYEQRQDRETSTLRPKNETFFVDRDPDIFAAILRYHDNEEYVGHSLSSPVSNAAVTPKSLLLEAQYYNLSSLEEAIDRKQSTESTVAVKYEYCHCTLEWDPYGPEIEVHTPVATFPLWGETAKKYADKGLDDFKKMPEEHALKISQWLYRSKNHKDVANGYRWTVIGVVNHDAKNQYGIILRGDKV